MCVRAKRMVGRRGVCASTARSRAQGDTGTAEQGRPACTAGRGATVRTRARRKKDR
jgi:hypothetical protein